MVQPKYSPEEALQRIKLMMEYDLSKTSTENKKVVLEQTKELTIDDIKNGKSVVKLGMKGPIVGKIQELLASAGYPDISKSGKIDNDFGSLTKGEVEKFQSEHKNDEGEPLQKDGEVGPETIKALLKRTYVKTSKSDRGETPTNLRLAPKEFGQISNATQPVDQQKQATLNPKGLETAVKGYVPATVQSRLRNDEPLTLLNQPIKFQQTQSVAQQTQPVAQQTQNVNNSVQNPELAAGYLDPNQQSTLRRRDSPLDDILKNQDINKSVCRKNISDYYNAWRTRSVVPDDVQKAAKNIVQNCAYQNYGKFGINGKRFNQMIDVLSGDARGVVGPNKSAGDGIWKIESPNRN
jgi:peptidoglycan hydrolase-like protein with peptidoglycan-binding domain